MEGKGSTVTLWAVMVVLAIAAIALPWLLLRMPLPLRVVVGFTNFTAAAALGLVLWQRSRRQ